MEEIIERWKDIFSTSSRTLPKMVQFHDSISKHLHHHTCSRMLFDKIFETHCAQILSCFSPEASTWLTTWLAFSTFWLFSPSFSTMLRTWFGLPHLSIVGIPQCVCTHPIDATGVHLLSSTHGNEHTCIHDVVHNIFAAFAWDANFHVGWKHKMHPGSPLLTSYKESIVVREILTSSLC